MVFKPSPFAWPAGSFQHPVTPPSVPLSEGPFFYIGVNCAWMPYIAGALQQLLLQSTWDCDAETLASVQGQVFDLISLFNCATAPTAEQLCDSFDKTGGDMGCSCLRFHNGKLQTLDCGEWVDVPGQTSGTNGGSGTDQPASGAEQPQPNGGCATYHAQMPADQKWAVPFPVSTGDTLQVSKLNGASLESGDILWFGPDGRLFFAGQYQGSPSPAVGTDPVPGGSHQALIVTIGATSYSLTPGPFTVPSGVSNEQATVQLNTQNISDLSGSVTFDLEVCNNQAGEWEHTFDFTTGTHQFASHPRNEGTSCNPGAEWTAGVGWTPDFCSGITAEWINMSRSYTLTRVATWKFFFHTSESSPAFSDAEIYTDHSGTEVLEVSQGVPWTDPQPVETPTITVDTQGVRFRIGVDDTTDVLVLYKAIATGRGVDPFAGD